MNVNNVTVPRLSHEDSAAHSLSSGSEHGAEKRDNKPIPHEEGENGTNALSNDIYWEPAEGVEQDDGVTRIEALYIVYGKGWGLFALWASIALIAYVYALSQNTTYYYEQFATSYFGSHSLIGTITVITGIMAGVAQPFVAKFADIVSRPMALSLSVVFYFVGYAVVAGAKNVETVAGGMVIYTLGNTGIQFMNSLLVADITSLQWRGAIFGAIYLPFVVNAFVAGYITEGISAYSSDGWRWGYGMFCILVPVCIAPALIVLFAGDIRAKKLGALSLAAPSYYRKQVLAGMEPVKPPMSKMIMRYWSRMNGFGLLLLGFAFGCILTPFTLSRTAKGGYNNPSLIALLVVGGLLFIAWCVWDGFYARYPIMPKAVFNRTFLSCVGINFMYYFSGYFIDVYWSSYVYVIVDWSDRNYTFYNNIGTIMLCGFAVFSGLVQRYTHSFKWLQISGLAIRCLGVGLNYAACKQRTTALLVSSRVITGLGGAISVISSSVASQGSVPHQYLAIATAVLNLWTQIGGAISSAISASVWTERLPAKLEEHLGGIYDATTLSEIFGSITVAREIPERELIRTAYSEAFQPLLLAALLTSFVGLAFGFTVKDYKLGENHNDVETHKIMRMRNKEEVDENVIATRVKIVEEKIAQETLGQRQAGSLPQH